MAQCIRLAEDGTCDCKQASGYACCQRNIDRLGEAIARSISLSVVLLIDPRVLHRETQNLPPCWTGNRLFRFEQQGERVLVNGILASLYRLVLIQGDVEV